MNFSQKKQYRNIKQIKKKVKTYLFFLIIVRGKTAVKDRATPDAQLSGFCKNNKNILVPPTQKTHMHKSERPLRSVESCKKVASKPEEYLMDKRNQKGRAHVKFFIQSTYHPP